MSFFGELCTITVAGTGNKSVSLPLQLDFDQLQALCAGSATVQYLNGVQFMLTDCVHAAEYFEDRTDVQCLHRWQKVLNPELVKGPWTREVRRLLQR